MQDTDRKTRLMSLTADVVSSHISNNPVSVTDLPGLIKSVFSSFSVIGTLIDEKATASARSSITPDYLVCLEDGRKLKMLRRHLMVAHRMTPEQYRAKWKLPADYPIVAANYVRERREIAKTNGLGRVDRPETKPGSKRRSPKAAGKTRNPTPNR